MTPPGKKTQTVADAMRAPFAAIYETDTVAVALLRMEELPALSLSVISASDRWKGLLLGKQLIALRKEGLPVDRRTVGEFARPELAVSPDDSIEAASRLMSEHRLSRLPVVERRAVVGSLNEPTRAPGSAWRPSPIRRCLRTSPGGGRQASPPDSAASRAGPRSSGGRGCCAPSAPPRYHLVSVAARSGLLRSLFGLPDRLATPPGAPLGEREARVAEVRNTLARPADVAAPARAPQGRNGDRPPPPP